MRYALVSAVLAALFFVGAVRAADDPSVALPGVVDLTPDNFDALVNGRKHVLAEFYAPWCGHCKRMTPEFKKLGEHITSDSKLNSRVLVAKVNADKYGDLGSRFDVKGFPTILYFPRGKPVEQHTTYQGGRTFDDFLKFLEDQLEADKGFARSPALDELATAWLDAAPGDGQDSLIAKAAEVVATLAKDVKSSGELYGKYMAKAVTKGNEYFQKEYDRLDRIISSGAVSPAKMTEVAAKASVLTAFIPSMNEPEAATDKAAEAEE